jgi:twitching motility protein PilU
MIPALDTLGVPAMLSQLVMEKRGLILMVGATGTGKSTTLASMLEWRNQQMTGHILTIEDPIEFLFSNKKSHRQPARGRPRHAVLQMALKNALRQAPDCILIGEIRDRETMTSALSYALSGHLVLATLHANNSYHALGRILSFYTPEARPTLLSDLAAACAPSSRSACCAPTRRPRAGGGGAAQHQAGVRADREGRPSRRQGSDGEVAGRRLADLREDIARLIKKAPSRATKAWPTPIRRPTCCGACRTTRPPVSRAAPKKEEPESATFTEITIDVVPEDTRSGSLNPATWPRRT